MTDQHHSSAAAPVIRWWKRARLIAVLPLVFLFTLVFVLVTAPFVAWFETVEEFSYRWHGGYGG